MSFLSSLLLIPCSVIVWLSSQGIVATCILKGPTDRDAETKNFEVDEKAPVVGQDSERIKNCRDGCSHGGKPEPLIFMQHKGYLQYRKYFHPALLSLLNVHNILFWKAYFQ